jgi:hypothetical protein
MVEPENEATQYDSPNEESRNAEGSDSYESPSPLYPPCTKRQRALDTKDPDYVLEQPIYDHWKLNVIIYTIEVLRMTLSTFSIESTSTLTCPIIVSSRSRRKGFSYAGESTKS